jgi:phosphoglycerate dehydrogenase-like enzyme
VVRHAKAELALLERSGFDLVDRTVLDESASEDQLISALAGAWAVIAGGERYSRRVIDAVPTLRAIARTGIGFDAIDVTAATESRVAVIVTPGANSESVADFAVALALSCLRGTIEADQAVRSGAWRPRHPGRDLFGATVGIVGFGRIGQAFARRLKGFGCRLLVVESVPDNEACQRFGVELVTLEEMLPQVDVLSLHVPLTDETRHIIGRHELHLMQAHAIVINTSRGAVVDGAALAESLRQGVVGGAGLDVFEEEPLPLTDGLIELPNVVLAGHISSFTHEAMARMMTSVSASLVALAIGRVPSSCVNRDSLEPQRAPLASVEGSDA